jgi:stress-induced-phosphoprotein 1
MATEGKGNHYKVKGNEALKAGKLQEAIDNYTKAVELEPDNAIYYSNRSAAYAQLEDFNKSAEDGQKAIELKPDWPKGYSRKAYALSKLGKYQEMKETCEAGLKIDHDNQQLKDSLAEAERLLQSLQNCFITSPMLKDSVVRYVCLSR